MYISLLYEDYFQSKVACLRFNKIMAMFSDMCKQFRENHLLQSILKRIRLLKKFSKTNRENDRTHIKKNKTKNNLGIQNINVLFEKMLMLV